MIYSIQTCVFKRKKFGDWEQGLLLNEDYFKIIDGDGKLVKKVYNYRVYVGIALFNLSIGGGICR